jgi:hypothetical protein
MQQHNATFETQALAALLEASTRAIELEVVALSPETLRWRPAPGEWCVNEVVGHLIEADQRGFAGRIRTMLDEDQPHFLGWDQDAVARDRHDDDRDGRALVAEFVNLRAGGIALVRGLTPEQLSRTGVHARVGELAVSDILHEWVHHDRNHLKQIATNVQLLLWPSMGNAQRFSQPQW